VAFITCISLGITQLSHQVISHLRQLFLSDKFKMAVIQ